MEKKSVKVIRKYATPIRSMMHAGGDGNGNSSEFLAWEAHYNEQGHLIHEIKFHNDGSQEEVHSYTYDEKGNLIQHHLSVPLEGIEEKFITERNADGQPLKIYKIYGDDPGERTEYTYGQQALPVQVEIYDADGEHEQSESMLYDDQGKIITRKISPSNEPVREYKFLYDDKGNISAQEEYDENGKLKGKVTFKYDDDGRETEVRQLNNENKSTSVTTSEYNDNKQLVRKTSRGFYIRITSFLYDEKGNVTEESLSDENGFVISRNRYEFNDDNMLESETVYETDLTRGGRDTHTGYRYEYEFN